MEYITLKEVCEITMGQSPDSNSYNDNGEGVPFFQGNADFGEKYPIVRKWCTEPTKVAQKGEVLISVRAPIGAINFANCDCCIGRGLASIKPDKDLCSTEYIYWLLKSKNDELNRKGTGSTFKAINKKTLEEIIVPSNSFEEQQQIADTLNKVQLIITKRKEQHAKLDELIKARFVEMFGDPLSNPKGWEKNIITDLCKKIYGGGTPSKSKPEYFEGNIPWVSPKDMKSTVIYDSQDHITEDAITNSTTTLIPENSVLMVIRSGILKHTLPVAINAVPVTINQDMKAFVPGDKILAGFLMNYFKAIESDVLQGVRGVTADNIDFKDFQKRMIIVPPIVVQRKFELFLKQVNKSKFVVKKALEKAQLLFDSLMQQYFG